MMALARSVITTSLGRCAHSAGRWIARRGVCPTAAASGLALLAFMSATVAAPGIQSFSPQGSARDVRQITVRFSAPMVSLGDPRVEAPFDIACGSGGRGRWVDARNWVFEYRDPLPGGVVCDFTLKPGTRTIDGTPLGPAAFRFDTGGPAIRGSLPREGDASIDERQMFLLAPDAPVDAASVPAHAYCAADGVVERIPLTVVTGDERARLLAERRPQLPGLLARPDPAAGRPGELTPEQQAGILVVRCARPLPYEAQIKLVWGAGVRSSTGVAGREDQSLAFRVRPDFTVRVSCDRIAKDAGCVPILPISLDFSAPIPRRLADKLNLRTRDGRVITGRTQPERGPVESVRFTGPFPEKSVLTLGLPGKLVDDSGRALANPSVLERPIVIDEDPPLVKFSASFGILEARAEPALPVTVRNVEATLKAALVDARSSIPRPTLDITGRVVRLDEEDARLLEWMRRVRSTGFVEGAAPGERSLLGDTAAVGTTQPIEIPRPAGEKSFEVIGIPLPKPGFYVVEIASPRLGRVLNESAKPYHVASAALVTDMAVHFKHGRESSLAWVTRLADGKPVAGARVAVNDCSGRALWRGQTDASGLARINQTLTQPRECPGWNRELFVTARLGEDLSFMLTSWNDGISRFDFGLPAAQADGPIAAHTVFDRPLFRAGETVSMKHFVRLRTETGFRSLGADIRPRSAQVLHYGSGQTYPVPLDWTHSSATSRWTIPKDAKLGEYELQLTGGKGIGDGTLAAGTFRVEPFRVPLMRAQLKGPDAPPVNPASVTIDAQLAYTAGGPAAGAPVKLRSRIVPRVIDFGGYETYAFGGTVPKEGVEALRDRSDEDTAPAETAAVKTQEVTLDRTGGARITLADLARGEAPRTLEVEMEYADPNGQRLSTTTRVPLLAAALHLGIRADDYVRSRDRLAFGVIALDPRGQPLPDRAVTVAAYERRIFGYRKRLLGGFYAYEQSAEVKRLGVICSGRTDPAGRLTCGGAAPATGNLILVASADDGGGNRAIASRPVFVGGGDDWYGASSSDRIDVLPDKTRYRPGETARLEVRMPFREATALVTVEREGILETRVQPVSMRSPRIEVPIAAHFAPNAYVSVLVVRGRIDPEVPGPFAWLKRMVYQAAFWVGLVKEVPRMIDTRPTATVDLTRPSFRIGMTALRVGWDAHELKVRVEPEREAYRVRDRAVVKVSVTDVNGRPASSAEVAIAAVDEGLLALKANDSWQLLESMMKTRSLDVETATAQSQVIGRRHFGRKAVAAGGGGGAGTGARELFDTLLLWNPAITLDSAGSARVEVPLNDSLTAFRVAAIASAGDARFGHGSGTIRTTQDLMLFAGLPPVVREGDRFSAMLTVRNAAEKPLTVALEATMNGQPIPAEGGDLALKAGEARTIAFTAEVPLDARRLDWVFGARTAGGPADALKATQQVAVAQPVRVLQQTIAQLERPAAVTLPIELPRGAVPGRGGVEIRLARSVAGDLSALKSWMQRYPYTCLEQRVSRAVALEDATLWAATMSALPAFLDRDGLARFFATDRLEGDDTLTSYLLAIADASGRPIPEAQRTRMIEGLSAFVDGRIRRYGALPTADLALRKLAAIEALSRYGAARPRMLESIEIAPGLWPTSGILDWIGILQRVDTVPRRAERLAEAKAQLRARMDLSGTMLTFSSERSDYLWWLLVSPDLNAVRAAQVLLRDPDFRDDLPRLVRGAVGRQQGGAWATTVTNAWGVVTLRRFAEAFEGTSPSGTTLASLGRDARSLDWSARGRTTDPETAFAWPATRETLTVEHGGAGRPWMFVQTKAALPLTAPLAAGFTVQRTVTPLERKTKAAWSRGDLYRVTLEINAGSDRTWVVVNDPIPAGAAVLGSGLGGESMQGRPMPQDERAWLAFEERTFEGYRAYFRFVPRGRFTVSYTVRLDNPGRFNLPVTRVEAMYSPEVFAELPGGIVEVRE